METQLSEFKVLCTIFKKKIVQSGGTINESHLKLLFAELDDKTIELIFLNGDVLFKVHYLIDRKPIEELCSLTIEGWHAPDGAILDSGRLAERWLFAIDLAPQCRMDAER